METEMIFLNERNNNIDEISCELTDVNHKLECILQTLVNIQELFDGDIKEQGIETCLCAFKTNINELHEIEKKLTKLI